MSSTISSIRHHVFEPLLKNNISYDVYWHTLVSRAIDQHRGKETEKGFLDPFDVQVLNPCVFTLTNQESVRIPELERFAAARNVSLDSLNSHRVMRKYDVWDDNYVSVKNILGSYFTQADLAKMITLHAKLHKIKYDAILAIRPDTAVMRDIDLPTKMLDIQQHPNYLWVPDFHHWYGYNDRAAFGSLNVMISYLNRGRYFRDTPFTNTGENLLKVLEEKDWWKIQMSTMRVLRTRQNGCVSYRDYPKKINIALDDPDFKRCVPNTDTGELSAAC
eukprot:CAMPEP_0174959516 /NCGR_PEP_ID=MMETSP0004_2-20121128/3219_1 /TAXON_ID=420556 /ORGANISM="Ochromonas sp., Strain CCMP1393" /LENGTH=274 /DNA_ID=CAMNT_0016207841 /DNA_START=246 /DNA_END=1070 /DNA_ORIENTATION=+